MEPSTKSSSTAASNNHQNSILESEEGRIKIEKSLLISAIQGNSDSLSTMFYQFLPSSETIVKSDYYGFFGFWFVGFYSFACLTDKRLSTLRVGPFKKVKYRDAFYENMTSGGVTQPSLFWLYVFLIVGALIGVSLIFSTVSLLFTTVFKLFDYFWLISITIVVTLGLIPFLLNFIIYSFYMINSSGFTCWIRERLPLVVFVNRKKMLKGNQLYRVWSEVKEQRVKTFKKNKKLG